MGSAPSMVGVPSGSTLWADSTIRFVLQAVGEVDRGERPERERCRAQTEETHQGNGVQLEVIFNEEYYQKANTTITTEVFTGYKCTGKRAKILRFPSGSKTRREPEDFSPAKEDGKCAIQH
ncbi:hypothetical protein Bbelb_105000 [Branchiostoma belcheri]|nr:hypothetical protein Bbelb_105000 [Branchiostoma belcheri]